MNLAQMRVEVAMVTTLCFPNKGVRLTLTRSRRYASPEAINCYGPLKGGIFWPVNPGTMPVSGCNLRDARE